MEPKNVKENQLVAKPKQIGHLNGVPVMECVTKGGLVMVVKAAKDGHETLGAAAHKAIARHIALMENPDLCLSVLEKSDTLSKAEIEVHLPYYLQLTKRIKGLE